MTVINRLFLHVISILLIMRIKQKCSFMWFQFGMEYPLQEFNDRDQETDFLLGNSKSHDSDMESLLKNNRSRTGRSWASRCCGWVLKIISSLRQRFFATNQPNIHSYTRWTVHQKYFENIWGQKEYLPFIKSLSITSLFLQQFLMLSFHWIILNSLCKLRDEI